MSFKIANEKPDTDFLEVDSAGVQFTSGSGSGEKKQFRFSQIDCVLLSSANTLSLQVGDEVFTIPTNPADPKHANAISFLVQEVRRTTE